MLKRLLFLGCLVLTCVPASFAASDQWIEVSSSHFLVLTDSGEKEGRHLLDQFERMRWLYKTLFPKINADPPAPIQVYAVRNKKGFQAVEPAEYLGKDKLNLGGLFVRSPERDYILLRLDAEYEHPFSSVYHEYTHLMLTPAAEWLPLWLNEGLAEFFQNTDIHNKDVVLGQPSRDDILYLRQASLIPLPVLFRVDYKSPYYHEEERGSVFYAEAWAMTHYLEVTDRLNKTNRLADYMNLVAHREDPAVAAEKAFGDLKKLQSSLELYIRAGDYKEFVLSSAAAPLDEASYKLRTLTPQQTDVVRASILTAVGRVSEAQTLLTSVLQSNPNSVDALDAMGMIAIRNHDLEGARKWFSQSVKLDSQSYIAHFYYAQMSIGSPGRDAGDIEENLRAAIRLNPTFAPAYSQLASFELMRSGNLAEAHTLAVRAIQLDPASFAYRMNDVSILIAMKEYQAARTALENCKKLTRSAQQASIVQARIDDLDQMQAAHAVNRSGVVDIPANTGGGNTGVVEVPDTHPIHPVDIAANAAPRHPTEPPTGPRHEVIGVIHGVVCSYPSVLELRVEGGAKPVSLYTNNYFKLEFSALGYTPTGELHPCQDLEGKKARIEYAEVSDKTVAGQIVSVELRK